jgi:hypothetical protein
VDGEGEERTSEEEIDHHLSSVILKTLSLRSMGLATAHATAGHE